MRRNTRFAGCRLTGKRSGVASDEPELGLFVGGEAVLPLEPVSFFLLFVEFVLDGFFLVGDPGTADPLDAGETPLLRAV